MANLCVNHLTITGTPEHLDRFIEENKGVVFNYDEPISMEKAVPMPYNLNDEDEEKWIDKNWGVNYLYFKQDENQESIGWQLVSQEQRVITFYSPEGPPWAWFQTLAEANPSIDLNMLCYEGATEYFVILRGDKGKFNCEDGSQILKSFLKNVQRIAKEERENDERNYIEKSLLRLAKYKQKNSRFYELFCLMKSEQEIVDWIAY